MCVSQVVACAALGIANDGVVPPWVSVPGPAPSRPRGLAALDQLGRVSSLVEVNVAI